mmetsp:Transcript_105585/g.305483  ORF Transcript_105585/g.305483 Transcript_105585/m.305483 type:complete len:268 (-) Transcript_105585:268-1071(-)
MLKGTMPTRRMGCAPSTSSVWKQNCGLFPRRAPPPCSPALRSPGRLPWMWPMSWLSVVGATSPRARRSSAQRACNDVASAGAAASGTRYLGSRGLWPLRPERAGPSKSGVQHAGRASPGAAGRFARHGSCAWTGPPRGVRNSASRCKLSRYSRRTGTVGAGAAPSMSETSSVSRPLDRTVGGGAASQVGMRYLGVKGSTMRSVRGRRSAKRHGNAKSMSDVFSDKSCCRRSGSTGGYNGFGFAFGTSGGVGFRKLFHGTGSPQPFVG